MTKKATRFYHSLYFKMAGTFLAGMIIILLLELRLSVTTVRSLVSEINQSLEWDVASSVANFIQPRLLEPLESDEFLDLIYPFASANPKLEFYLLHSDGKIFAHYSPSHSAVADSVDLVAIKSALSDFTPNLPLFGDNPGLSKSIDQSMQFETAGSVFSVSPIKFNQEDGFLYVIIEGLPFSRRIRLLGQFFLARILTSGWILAAVATLGLAYLFFILLTRKFRTITAAVKRYEQGDYSQPLNINTRDEIGVLSNALNSMSEKLILAKAEIEERDRKRRELIAFITHDLRSPLAATQGYLDMALASNEIEESKTIYRYTKLAADNSRLQARLVEDLFELSKLEAQEREPNFDEFLLEELIKKIISQFIERANLEQIKINLEIQGESGYVLADDSLITRVFNNLIENSLRFTPASGSIQINLEYKEKTVDIKLEDSGCGIAPEDKNDLMESFAQAKVKENESHTGAGLGLSIVQRILGLHQSELTISSTPGVGSCFQFSLPLADE